MARSIMKGSAWKEELKLQIYRHCFNALAKARQTSRSLVDCLAEEGVELEPRKTGYTRKENKDAPYTAFFCKCGATFHLMDLPFPRWAGWKAMLKEAQRVGAERALRGMFIRGDHLEIDCRGCDADLLNSIFGIAEPSHLKARARIVRFAQDGDDMVVSESMVTGQAQQELELHFAM